MTSRRRTWLVVTLAGGLAGALACRPLDPVTPRGPGEDPDDNGLVCTAQAVPAITVLVVDSLTNRTPPFIGVWARARDGAYSDSTASWFTSQGGLRLSLAYEHRGTLDVTVQVTGYRPWQKSGVVVTGDKCHVTTVLLTARVVRP
jgi:hypothetical protein